MANAWPEPTFDQLLRSLLDEYQGDGHTLFELRALIEGSVPSKLALRPFNPNRVVQLESVCVQLTGEPDPITMISRGDRVNGTKVWLEVGPPFIVPHLEPRQIITLLHARERRARCQHCQHVTSIARGASFYYCPRCGAEQVPEL